MGADRRTGRSRYGWRRLGASPACPEYKLCFDAAFPVHEFNVPPCNETFWLKEKLLDLQVFPDVMVRCGPVRARGCVFVRSGCDRRRAVGSEARDRHEKWELYQKLDSVKHYVLVARDKAHVEVSSRGEGEWSGFQVLEGLGAALKLPAIDFEIALAEIYRDVLNAL